MYSSPYLIESSRDFARRLVSCKLAAAEMLPACESGCTEPDLNDCESVAGAKLPSRDLAGVPGTEVVEVIGFELRGR